MKIRVLEGSRDEALWDQYVSGHPQASGYHLLAWRRVITQAFGHPTYYLMAVDEEGAVQGVLPLVLTKSPIFGCYLTSMAFLNYGGVLADRVDAYHALLAAAAETARQAGAGHIELRQGDRIETDWPMRLRKVSMRLSLPPDGETLWTSYPSKLRSQIRRARKEGMKVDLGGLELLDDYYRVFARCMRDLGTPVYGKKFFRLIIETFPKEVRLCVVSLNGLALAAGLLYGFRDRLEIPWAAADRRYNRLAPNMLLYGSVLEFACREGFREFDFGRSSVDSRTYRFKQQWGARPRQLYWYYWLGTGRNIPELNPENPRFKVAIALWRRLPLSVANVLGPPIVKYLP